MQFRITPWIADYDGHVAIVLGGAYVNALHLVRAVGRHAPVVALNHEEDPGLYSKFVSQRIVIDHLNELDGCFNSLVKIGKQLKNKAVIFPTSDLHIKVFATYYDQLDPYYFLPVNPDTAISLLSKESQYRLCSAIGVPFPKTFFIRSEADIQAFWSESDSMMFPLIIKPSDATVGLYPFKNREISDREALQRAIKVISESLQCGYVISEMIPGEPDNIWVYIGYCDNRSDIVAGWTARKLTQRPYYHGVFSSASYERNETVAIQAEMLLRSGKYIGIGEPEFKFDRRDNKYKLIEINPRYMMFHGLGVHGGINLPLIHYYQATGNHVKLAELNKTQNTNKAHIVFLYFEFLNMVDHKPLMKYLKNFTRSFFRKNKVWGIFSLADPAPFGAFLKMVGAHLIRRRMSVERSGGN